jgi:predicted ATP-dependent endonuclease of OLD family
MVKINEIKVKGFKNIKSAELSLNNFNVIIGANNSGKSNFIQVIPFLNYVINASQEEVKDCFTFDFFKSYFKSIIPQNDVNDTRVLTFKITFSNTVSLRQFSYTLEINIDDEDLPNDFLKINLEKLETKDPNKPGPALTLFIRNSNTVKYGSALSKTNLLEDVPSYYSVLRLLNIINLPDELHIDTLNSLNEILKTPIFYFSHIEFLKSDKERIGLFNGRLISFDLENEIIALERTDKWDIFKEALVNILNIDSINILRLEDDSPLGKQILLDAYLFFTHTKIQKSLADFSDGTILIIALITKVLSAKHSIIFIEEPENSTHPKALIDLIAFIKSFSETTQFVITSHSIAILNKTKIEDIIVSSIDENGAAELYNVSSRKDLKSRLKRSSVNFSDELFFALEDKAEFD